MGPRRIYSKLHTDVQKKKTFIYDILKRICRWMRAFYV